MEYPRKILTLSKSIQVYWNPLLIKGTDPKAKTKPWTHWNLELPWQIHLVKKIVFRILVFNGIFFSLNRIKLLFSRIFDLKSVYCNKQHYRIMEQELSFGVKLLNGFLKFMIACLIGILVAIPIALILDWIGLI